jgi:Family of unknown function (DUF6166)
MEREPCPSVLLARGRMKTYRGHCIGGCTVTVDGRPLPPRLDLVNHSPTGYGVGYGGSGAAQLALAILADHLGKGPSGSWEEAQDLYQAFKWRVIAALPHGEWTLTSEDIDRALAEIRPQLEAGGTAGTELAPSEVPF